MPSNINVMRLLSVALVTLITAIDVRADCTLYRRRVSDDASCAKVGKFETGPLTAKCDKPTDVLVGCAWAAVPTMKWVRSSDGAARTLSTAAQVVMRDDPPRCEVSFETRDIGEFGSWVRDSLPGVAADLRSGLCSIGTFEVNLAIVGTCIAVP